MVAITPQAGNATSAQENAPYLDMLRRVVPPVCVV
jgi:hypothetical protein